MLDEPSVVARIKEKGSYVPYAFGKKAKMMLGLINFLYIWLINFLSYDLCIMKSILVI